MKRPVDLPDFSNPPLDEVVLNVQFTPIPGYSSVDAGDIWKLFKAEFPTVEEQPPLAPQFEAFGGWTPQVDFGFQFAPHLQNARLWFLSEDQKHILQFQSDRLTANWRKINGVGEYPRFEQIVARFEQNLKTLSAFVQDRFGHALEINQAEISYINAIPVETFDNVDDWLVGLGEFTGITEGFSFSSRVILHDEDDKVPCARLHTEVTSAMTPDMVTRVIRMAFTVRGRRADGSINEAVKFIKDARETIVKRFAAITTEKAHKYWGKT